MSEHNADINGLKTKNQELIGSEKKLKESIEEMTKGRTDLESQVADLTEKIKTASDDKTKEEFYNNELEKKQKEFDKELVKLQEENASLLQYKHQTIRSSAIKEGTEGLTFVNDTMKEAFVQLCLAEHKFEPKDIDGKTVFLEEGNKRLEDVLKEFALSERGKNFIASGNAGGGLGNSNVNTDTNLSTPKRADGKVDIAKLMQLYQNPSTRNQAIQMAREVGLKL